MLERRVDIVKGVLILELIRARIIGREAELIDGVFLHMTVLCGGFLENIGLVFGNAAVGAALDVDVKVAEFDYAARVRVLCLDKRLGGAVLLVEGELYARESLVGAVLLVDGDLTGLDSVRKGDAADLFVCGEARGSDVAAVIAVVLDALRGQIAAVSGDGDLREELLVVINEVGVVRLCIIVVAAVVERCDFADLKDIYARLIEFQEVILTLKGSLAAGDLVHGLSHRACVDRGLAGRIGDSALALRGEGEEGSALVGEGGIAREDVLPDLKGRARLTRLVGDRQGVGCADRGRNARRAGDRLLRAAVELIADRLVKVAV